MSPLLAIALINTALIALVVTLHYEFLYRISVLVPRLITRHRPRILVGVFASLVAHSVEIWLFGVGYFLSHHHDSLGELRGNYDGGLLDSAYFSFTTYTTLGFGDIEPTGLLRFTVGMEALTGLVLITWTASFLFVEMQRYWNDR